MVPLTMDVVRKRWMAAEKKDPFDTVSDLFKEHKYETLAAMINNTGGTVCQRLAIPAALVLVQGLDYQEIAGEMKARGAYGIFMKRAREARRIAYKALLDGDFPDQGRTLPITTLDDFLGGHVRRPRPPDPEYKRMYDMYRVTPV